MIAQVGHYVTTNFDLVDFLSYHDVTTLLLPGSGWFYQIYFLDVKFVLTTRNKSFCS